MNIQQSRIGDLLSGGLVLLLIGILSCMPLNDAYAQKKSKRKSKKKGKNAVQQLSPEDDVRVQQLFFSGLTARIKGDIDGATTSFKEALKIHASNDAILHELAKIYYEQQDKEQALYYAEAAANLRKENKWYQFLYAEVLAQNLQFEQAAKVYQGLVKYHPNEIDYYFDWGYMLIQANKFEESVKVYDQLEQKIGIIEDIVLQKQKLYIRLGKVDKAAAELRKLIDNDPSNPKFYLMLGDLYQINNRNEAAFKLYQEMAEKAPSSPYANLALAQYYHKTGETAKYLSELKKAFAAPNLPIELKAEQLNSYLETFKPSEENKKNILELIESLLTNHPKHPLPHMLHGDMLMAYNQKSDALAAFQEALVIEANHFEVWNQVMLLQYELSKLTELITTSKEAIELYPNQPGPYYFNGLANNQLDKHKEAIKHLKKASMIAVNNTNLQAQAYSLIADSYNAISDFENSDKYFDKSLQLIPDDPTVLNNYSYFLSVRGDNLELAAEMSEKSNKLSPNSASYQDTYAWVLYKLKRYDDAKVWIEKALKNGGSKSGVILEHYGDILYQMGNIDEAVAQWQSAKATGRASDKIDKKIRDKKHYD